MPLFSKLKLNAKHVIAKSLTFFGICKSLLQTSLPYFSFGPTFVQVTCLLWRACLLWDAVRYRGLLQHVKLIELLSWQTAAYYGGLASFCRLVRNSHKMIAGWIMQSHSLFGLTLDDDNNVRSGTVWVRKPSRWSFFLRPIFAFLLFLLS